jgi:hypothetical protein
MKTITLISSFCITYFTLMMMPRITDYTFGPSKKLFFYVTFMLVVLLLCMYNGLYCNLIFLLCRTFLYGPFIIPALSFEHFLLSN